MNRIDTLTVILERWHELIDPMQSGNQAGDTGLRLMPATYNPSVREVERLLRVMREDRIEPLVRWTFSDVAYTASVRSLWWHVSERYVKSRASIKEVPETRRAKGGKRLLTLERRVVVSHNPRVSQAHVERGLRYLADAWALPHEPFLPCTCNRPKGAGHERTCLMNEEPVAA